MPLNIQGQMGSLAKLLETPEGRIQVATMLAAKGITPDAIQGQVSGLLGPGQGFGADVAGPPGLDTLLAPGPVLSAQGTALPTAPPPPVPAPAPAPLPVPEKSDADRLLEALAAIESPAAPPIPQLPSGTAPLPRLGGTVDPQLLELVRKILTSGAGAGTAPVSSLGGAITGGRR